MIYGLLYSQIPASSTISWRRVFLNTIPKSTKAIFFTAVLTKVFVVRLDHLHPAHGRNKSLRNVDNYLVIYMASYCKIPVSSKPPTFTDHATTEERVLWFWSNLVVGCKSVSVEYLYEILVLPSGLGNSLSPNAWQNLFRKLIREGTG
jgi:uncharacterized membrane protein